MKQLKGKSGISLRAKKTGKSLTCPPPVLTSRFGFFCFFAGASPGAEVAPAEVAADEAVAAGLVPEGNRKTLILDFGSSTEK